MNIIYFGNDWFAENRTSSHHIARRLSRRHRLLYIDSPGFRPPRANTRDARKIYAKLRGAFRLPQKVHEGIWHVVIPQIPYRQLPGMRHMNQLLASRLVRRAGKSIGFDDYILWFAAPDLGAVAGHLDEQLVVYYCTDHHASLPHVNAPEVERLDDELTRRADQVFVCSKTLLEKKKLLNSSTVYSPHGVDVDLFERAADPSLPIAEAARNLQHPVIGYFGLISGWFDLDLIRHLAMKRPGWTFLLLGLVSVDLGDLNLLPNVVFAGQQPYESLPHWAKAFDVALYPARANGFSMNANPLKIREYLAAGKPVVSISTEEVLRFSDVVRTAATPEEFLNQIEEALRSDSEQERLRRMQAVRHMSWDARVEDVMEIVGSRLKAAHPELAATSRT